MERDFENDVRDVFEETSDPPHLLTSIFEWMEAIVASFILVVLIFTFLFRVVLVDGNSMNMTLHNQDRVLVFDLMYQPKRGDVVVVTNATEANIPIIKRVIGLGGDTIRIDYETGEVFVNDSKALPENYIFEPMEPPDGEPLYEVEVPPGTVFVMGDNRNFSDDSRNPRVGMVDTQLILGKAIFRIFPLSDFGKIHSPDLNRFILEGTL